MPYSCCTTAMSLSFSNSQVATTDLAEPLTSSPITRASEDDDPSATRTTLTSEPFAHNPSDRAALNVANPHGVGGYVLRSAKLVDPQGFSPTGGSSDVSRVERMVKGDPDGRSSPVCPARAAALRDQRRTADFSPDWLGFPTLSTLHVMTCCCRVSS